MEVDDLLADYIAMLYEDGFNRLLVPLRKACVDRLGSPHVDIVVRSSLY